MNIVSQKEPFVYNRNSWVVSPISHKLEPRSLPDVEQNPNCNDSERREFPSVSSSSEGLIKNSHNCNKPLLFNRFHNKRTGQWCYVPAGRYANFQNSIKKIKQFVQYNFTRAYCAHVSLTIADPLDQEDYSKSLHRVQQYIARRLSRSGTQFKAIAVKENQSRGVLHFHMLCFYDKAYQFPSAPDIERSWRLGGVHITAPKGLHKVGKIINYIAKYIGKGYEYSSLDYRKSFSASQIKQIYKLSRDRLATVLQTYGRDLAEGFKCTYRRVMDGGNCVLEFMTDWVYWGKALEPF
jgi:hypothetical protein